MSVCVRVSCGSRVCLCGCDRVCLSTAGSDRELRQRDIHTLPRPGWLSPCPRPGSDAQRILEPLRRWRHPSPSQSPRQTCWWGGNWSLRRPPWAYLSYTLIMQLLHWEPKAAAGQLLLAPYSPAQLCCLGLSSRWVWGKAEVPAPPSRSPNQRGGNSGTQSWELLPPLDRPTDTEEGEEGRVAYPQPPLTPLL